MPFPTAAAKLLLATAVAAATTASAAYAPAYERAGCANDPTNALLATGYPESTAAVENYFIASDSVNRGGLSKAAYCASECAKKGALFAALSLRPDTLRPENRGTDVCTCGAFFDPVASGADAAKCKPASASDYCDEDEANGQCAAKGYAAVFKLKNIVPCPSDPTYVMFEAPPQEEEAVAPAPKALSRYCYRFEGSTSKAASWTQANAACIAEGGRLATIDTPEENKFILSLPNSINTGNIQADFWVGGIYYGPANGFEWTTGRVVTYTDWMENEPATEGGRMTSACLDVATATPTPLHGSWSARACNVPKRFMCKKYANATENDDNKVLPPRVQAIAVGAETACVDQSLIPHLSSGPNLEMWLTFDKPTVDTEANTAGDSSSYERNATFVVNTESGATLPYEYKFETNPLTFGDTLVFDGNLTAVLPTGFTLSNDRTLSVTAWVKTTNQSGRVRPYEAIVSKARNNEAPAGPASWAWALYVKDNSQYCFAVGAFTACSLPTNALFKLGDYVFVSGVYDGRTVSVYINSVQAGGVTTQGALIPLNSSTPIVIGGAHTLAPAAQTSPERVSFEGVLDDLRVFSVALPIGDIEYLDTCALLSPFTNKNTITAYAGEGLDLVVLGHALGNGVHRLGLSSVGCAAGTPFETAAGRTPVYMRGYMSSTRLTVTFPTSQFTAGGVFDICYTSPNTPDAYEGGVGLKMRVLAITGLNGGKRKVYIDTDDKDGKPFVSADVEVNGVNLQNYSVVVLSPFRTCNYPYGSTPGVVVNVSDDGSKGTLVVYHAPVNTEYYYLCWAGSAEDAHSLSRVVATDLVIELTGARYQSKLVARNDGSTRVDATAITDGFDIERPNGERNFFTPCASLNEGDEDFFYFKVTMGDFTDFILPAPGRTPCDTLLGATWEDPWSGEDTMYNAAFYSIIDPAAPYYDAQLTSPIPRAGLGALGGSAVGFPIDGRQELSRWGSDLIGFGSNTVGGCCQSKLHQPLSWGLPYTITAYTYDPNKVYFQVDEMPYVVFPAEQVSIRLRVVDIHGRGFYASRYGNYSRGIPGGCVFKVTHTWQKADGTSETKVYTETSVNCDHVFRQPLNADTASFTVEGSFADPAKAGKTIANSNTTSFSVSTSPLPYDSYLLNSGENFTHLLSFRAVGGLESVITTTMAENPQLSLFEPSDRDITPQEMQPMTAFDYHKFPVGEYKWTWRQATATAGSGFGARVAAPMGVQYFAFAFYTTVGQKVAFNGGCPAYRRANWAAGADCAMFVGGKPLPAGTNEIAVYSGWHQVVIKLTNTRAISNMAEGFWLNMDGNGLAFNVDKPLGAPEGTKLLYEGGIIEDTLIYLKNPIVVNSFDESSTILPNGVPENRMYPTLDGDWLPFSSTKDGVRVSGNSEGIGKYQSAIHYFGQAVYATSAGSATFTIPKAIGAVRVYFNGAVVANYPADLNGRDRVISVSLRYGWSQFFFKVSAVAGTEWQLKMVATKINECVIFADALIPDTLPVGVTNFKERPLGAALALLSQSSQYYGLPFDTTNTTDPAAADPAYTQVNTSSLNKNGDPETVEGIPFVWTSVTAQDDKTGVIGEHFSDGGGYNRYYSFALYASRDAPEINVTLDHYEGAGVWFDGAFIGGRVSDNMNGTSLTLINVTRGWHTVHVRLQAENSLKFVNVRAGASQSEARQACAKEGLAMCYSATDMCPYNAIRKDIGAPFAGSVWAAVDTMAVDVNDAKWVQVGDASTGDSGVCMIHNGPLDDDDEKLQRQFRAACCGTVRPSYFRFSVTGFPARSTIGWAAAPPAPAIARPTITATQTPGRREIVVNITHRDPNAQIFYTFERSQYPNQHYSTPIIAPAGSIVVRAIARVDFRDSPVIDREIRFATNVTISRDACTAGPDCFVQLSRMYDATAQFANMLVVAVDTSDDGAEARAVLDAVVANSSYVRTANPATAPFTTFIGVDANNIVKVPAAFTSRAGLTSVTLVLFPASAATRNVAGEPIELTIDVAPFLPFAGTAFRGLEASPFAMTGSFAGGDRYAFPELVLSEAEWAALSAADGASAGPICAPEACGVLLRYEQEREIDPTAVPHVKAGPIFTTVEFQDSDNFFADTTAAHVASLAGVSCACVESRGGLTLGRTEYRAYAAPRLVTFAAAGENSTVALQPLPPYNANERLAVYSYGPMVVEARPAGSDEAANRIVVRGNFPTDAANKYVATLECAKAVAYVTTRFDFECSEVVPTVSVASNDGSTMTLHIHAPDDGRNVQGLWTLRLATEAGLTPNVPLNYARNYFIAIQPPAAFVTAADGDCPHSSDLCVSGTVVNFHGYNFNYADPSRNKIELFDTKTNAISKGVFCTVVAATNTSVSCRLALTAAATRTQQLVRVFVRIEAVPAPRHSGGVYGSSLHDSLNGLDIGNTVPGARGWSGELGPGPAPTIRPTTTTTTRAPGPNPNPDNNGGDDNSNVGIIAAIVCGGVLFIFIMVAIFVITKYDLLPKKRRAMNSDNNTIGESLNPGEQEAV